MGKEAFRNEVVVYCSDCLKRNDSPYPWDLKLHTFKRQAVGMREIHLEEMPDHKVIILNYRLYQLYTHLLSKLNRKAR